MKATPMPGWDGFDEEEEQEQEFYYLEDEEGLP